MKQQQRVILVMWNLGREPPRCGRTTAGARRHRKELPPTNRAAIPAAFSVLEPHQYDVELCVREAQLLHCPEFRN